jgi:hypothetical protein
MSRLTITFEDTRRLDFGAAIPDTGARTRPAPSCCVGYGPRLCCTKRTRDSEGLCRDCRAERRRMRARKNWVAFDAAETAWRSAR